MGDLPLVSEIVCVCVCCLYSAEIDQKLQEIMKQTGYLKIDGQVRCAHRDTSCFRPRLKTSILVKCPSMGCESLWAKQLVVVFSRTAQREQLLLHDTQNWSVFILEITLAWAWSKLSFYHSGIQQKWQTWSVRGRSAAGRVGRSSKSGSRRQVMSSLSK